MSGKYFCYAAGATLAIVLLSECASANNTAEEVCAKSDQYHMCMVDQRLNAFSFIRIGGDVVVYDDTKLQLVCDADPSGILIETVHKAVDGEIEWRLQCGRDEVR